MLSRPWLRSYAVASPANKGLGFFDGVGALLGGLGFIVSTPSAWGWALVPVLAATLLFGAGAWLAVWLGAIATAHLAGASAETLPLVGTWLVRIVATAIGLVVAFFLAMSLAQPLSGFALDALARKQAAARGATLGVEVPLLTGLLRSLRVSLTALAVGLPVLALLALITLLFPPAGIVTVPLKLVVTGLLVAYDLLDYPLSQRGHGVRERLAFMRTNIGAMIGFGVTAAALLLIPGMALFLLPFGVAGATRLVVRR